MVDEDAHDVSQLVASAKYGQWEEVFLILDRKPNLINCIPEDRVWGVLHQAAWWQNEDAVVKLLYQYPTCDSEIKTKRGRSESGPGKTPEWIARIIKGNQKIADLLLGFHTNKRNERFGGEIPTCITYQEGRKIDRVGPSLLVLTLASYKKVFHPSKIDVGTAFKQILKQTFQFEIEGSNWKHAMQKICSSIGAFDKEAADFLSEDVQSHGTTDEQRFFARTIKLYSKDHVYHQVNESLRRQSIPTNDGRRYRPTADDLALGPFSLFLDVLLFYWMELTRVSTKTYRGGYLKDSDIKKYTKNTRFVWLNFVSSSKNREIAIERFARNVLFEISNDTPGTAFWRPRDLDHVDHDLNEFAEEEALYPAGAEFEVTADAGNEICNGKYLTVIKLRLMCPA